MAKKISAIKPGLVEFDEARRQDKKEMTYKTSGRYLGHVIRDQGIELHGRNLIFIKSTKGTGKTKALGNYLKKSPHLGSKKILQLGHRRSLSRSLSTELGLTSYLDHSGLKQHFSLSLDSLSRINMEPNSKYDVLIFDESEQLFRHLFGSTTENKRLQIFSILIWLIQHAEQIICLDADLTTQLTIFIVEKLRKQHEHDKTLGIVNDYKTGRDISIYESKHHIIAQLITSIADGKNVFVPVGTKTLANQLEAFLQAMADATGKKIPTLVLTGDTSNEPAAQVFLENPTHQSEKYQVIIATSTLGTGVSIDGNWFDAIYGIFDGTAGTYQDFDQAISRVRKCNDVNVWLHKGQPPEFASEQALRKGKVEKEFATRRLIAPDESPALSEMESLYLDVETRVRWCQQQWSWNRLEQFIDLKETDGWFVLRIAADKSMVKAGQEILKVANDPKGDTQYSLILKASDLSGEQFSDLNQKKDLRITEKRAIQKWYIAKTYDLSSPADVTLIHIKQYYKHNSSSVVRNLKLMAADRQDALSRDEDERSSPNGKAFTSFDHRTIRREIMQSALESTGISMAEVMERANRQSVLDQEISTAKMSLNRDSRPYRAATKKYKLETRKNALLPDQHKLKETIDYVRDNLNKINLFLNTRYSESDLDKSPGRVLNKVMGEFGLSLKLVKGVFHVDYAKVTELAKTRKVLDAAKEIG